MPRSGAGQGEVLMHQGIAIASQFADGMQGLQIDPAGLVYRIIHMHMADFPQHQRAASGTMAQIQTAMQGTFIAHR